MTLFSIGHPPLLLPRSRAFQGFTGFYRWCVLNYATITATLTALTSSTVPFPPILPPAALDTFRTLQTALTTTPVLALPHTGPNSEFELYTDASIVGLGVVLLYDGHPIAFESRKLTLLNAIIVEIVEITKASHLTFLRLLCYYSVIIDENTMSRPIVLGVGGAMYTDTNACLLHLVVELTRVEKMCKLNMHATQAVSSILHARREEETARCKPG